MSEEKNKDDEATKEVNAPEPTDDEESSDEESSSNEDNLDESEEDKEEKIEASPKEIEKGYLEDKEEESYKKRYGDSTREYQTLQKKNKNLSSAIENLEGLSKLNPKIVEEIESAQRMSGNKGSSENSTLQRQIDDALEPVKKVARDIEDSQRRVKVKVLANFEKKNPNLFSTKATKKEKKEIRQRIGKVANALVESGMEFPEAVNRAYLTVNPKAAIQKGKDQAYLESLDEEQAGFSSQSSTEGKKPTEPKYSKTELGIGDKMGVGKAMRKDKS